MTVPQIVTQTQYVYPPDEYLKTCHPSFNGKTFQDIIVGLNSAIGRCNARIRAIQTWKEELQEQHDPSQTEKE